MNETFFEALVGWQSEGRRLVNIKMDSLHTPTAVSVHCHDYDHSISFFPTDTADIQDNILTAKREQLREQIARAERQLAALEGMDAA